MGKDSEGRENANMVVEYEKESNDFFMSSEGDIDLKYFRRHDRRKGRASLMVC